MPTRQARFGESFEPEDEGVATSALGTQLAVTTGFRNPAHRELTALEISIKLALTLPADVLVLLGRFSFDI